MPPQLGLLRVWHGSFRSGELLLRPHRHLIRRAGPHRFARETTKMSRSISAEIETSATSDPVPRRSWPPRLVTGLCLARQQPWTFINLPGQFTLGQTLLHESHEATVASIVPADPGSHRQIARSSPALFSSRYGREHRNTSTAVPDSSLTKLNALVRRVLDYALGVIARRSSPVFQAP